jgi:hypothetical protein
MFVRIIDENGFFVRDEFVTEITSFTIQTPCPDGFYRPRWDGTKWVEGMTQEEIDALKNQPQAPSIEDRVNALEDVMLFII